MGDLNAHICSLDETTDGNGQQLLDMDKLGLVLGNLEPKCVGQTTWSTGDRRSTIDISVMSPVLYHRLTSMVIDELGDHSAGSDIN